MTAIALLSDGATQVVRLAERRSTTLLTLLGTATAFTLAVATTRGRGFLLLVVIGAVAALVALAWPRAAVIAVVTGVFLLPARALPLGFAGVRTDLVELAAFALVPLALLPGAASWARTRPIAGPLLALGGAIAAGAALAAWQGAARTTIIGPAKTLLLYLVALPMIAILGDADGRAALERWIHRLCVFGGVMTLVVAATGGALTGDGSDEVVTLGMASEAQRLRPGVLSLMFLATVLVVHELALRGPAPGRILRLGLYTVVQLVSFNRSSWVPLVLAVALYSLLRPGVRREGRGLATLLIAIATAAVAFTAASAGILGPTASAIATRARSVTDPAVFQENSYQLRDQEDELAWEAIRERPILGVGLGQPYGNQVRVASRAPGGRTTAQSLVLHNSVLKAWLWLGVAGVVAFGWIGLRTVRLAQAGRRLPAVGVGSRAVASAAVLLALVLRSIFQTSLTSRSTIFTVAFALVFVVAVTSPDGEDRPT